MADKTTAKTKNNRLLALGYLVEAKWHAVPMQTFLDLLGTSDKARVTRSLIKPLQKAGHRILSLACGGYMLIDVPNERIINELVDLKSMATDQTALLISLVYQQALPLVPGSVPSDKPGKKRNTPKTCNLGGHPVLIGAITEAHNQDRPFTKTGRPGSNGIYARRMELPAPYNTIGRDRLERNISELLNAGEVKQNEAGFLIVSCA